MKSYHRTIDWHRRHDDAMVTQAPAAAPADSNDGLFLLTVQFYYHNSTMLLPENMADDIEKYLVTNFNRFH